MWSGFIYMYVYSSSFDEKLSLLLHCEAQQLVSSLKVRCSQMQIFFLMSNLQRIESEIYLELDISLCLIELLFS